MSKHTETEALVFAVEGKLTAFMRDGHLELGRALAHLVELGKITLDDIDGALELVRHDAEADRATWLDS